MARNPVPRPPVYWRITVSACRSHAGTDFRPGVAYDVREDLLADLADIIVSKEKVG